MQSPNTLESRWLLFK